MAKAVLQSNIQASDAGLTVAAGATVTIRDSDTLSLATLYTDRAGGTTKSNPVTADADGFFRAYVDAGRYNITATYSGDTQTFNDVVTTDDAIEFGNLINTTGNNQQINSGAISSQAFYVGGTSTINSSAIIAKADSGEAYVAKLGAAQGSGMIVSNNTDHNIELQTGSTLTTKATVLHAGGLSISDNAPATPTANTLYADSIAKTVTAVSYSGSHSIDFDVNVFSLGKASTGVVTIGHITDMGTADYHVGYSVDTPDTVARITTTTTGMTITTVTSSSTPIDCGFTLAAVGAQ